MTTQTIIVHNPQNLPTLPYTELVEFQGDLKDPITPENLKKMKKSLTTHGVFVPKFIWKNEDGVANILDGHQTKQALESLAADGWTIPPIPFVEVIAENRQDAARKLLQITSRYAKMNIDTSFFDDMELDDPVFELGKVELPDLEDIFGSGDFDTETEEEDDSTYSRKIEAPIYEITGDKPAIQALVNTEKADRLIHDIQQSALPDEEKTFLIRAAYRHDVFDFGKIAEYYAHSEQETQQHFESSTLIIIDFDAAIEDGYSKLAQDIEAQFREDYPNDES